MVSGLAKFQRSPVWHGFIEDLTKLPEIMRKASLVHDTRHKRPLSSCKVKKLTGLNQNNSDVFITQFIPNVQNLDYNKISNI